MRMMILLSLVHQDDACWRAVSLLQVQRQRNHMITAGSNTAEVQPFQHNNIIGKQDEVRGMAVGSKAIDGKIVDPDKIQPALREEFRRCRFEVDEVLVKAPVLPALGVIGLEEHATHVAPVQTLDVAACDRFNAGNMKDGCFSDKRFQRNLLKFSAAVREM